MDAFANFNAEEFVEIPSNAPLEEPRRDFGMSGFLMPDESLISRRNAEQLGLCTVSNVRSKPVDWLWFPYVPRGKVTILQGDPSSGKTTLILTLIAALTAGWDILDPQKHHMRHVCLYQTAEDGYGDTVRPRLERAGADLSQVVFLDDTRVPLELMDQRLLHAIKLVAPSLVVLDPIQAFLGENVDMHRANEIRPRMAYLAQIAEENDCAIVLIGHLNKRAGDDAIYRGLGSIDLVAAARSVLLMEKDRTDPARRILKHIKSSLAAEGAALTFRFQENGSLRYSGENVTEEREPKAVQVSYFLRSYLGAEEKPVNEVRDAIRKKFGADSARTWANARQLAQAETYKRGKIWMIRISPQADFGEMDDNDDNDENIPIY